MLSEEDFDYHCHSNLTRAVLPFGLAESDVHDVLNVFQVTGLNKDGQYFMSVSLPLSSTALPTNNVQGAVSRQGGGLLRVLRRN